VSQSGFDNALRMLGRFLVLAVASLFGFFISGILLKPVFPEGLPPGQARLIVVSSMSVFAVLVGHLTVVLLFERARWETTGLGPGGWRPVGLLLGIALGICTILLPAAVLMGLGHLQFVPTDAGPLLASYGTTALILAMPALFEELVLRGYILGAIAREWGAAVAIGITSLLFGLLHLGNPGASAWTMAAVVVAGVLLGALRLVTGSLAAAWLAHLAINWTQGGLLHAPISGLGFLPTPVYRSQISGPAWLTGGPWGLEASIPAAAAFALVTFLLFVARREGAGKRSRARVELS
jgi:uncharacterized protein